MIRNLIWDVDGTLFDTYPAIVSAFSQALYSFGASAPDSEVEALARVSLSLCTEKLSRRFQLDEDRLGRVFAELYRAIPKAEQPPFEGTRAVCEAILAAGGVNTIVTHRGSASTKELLSTHGMTHLFVDIVAADEGYPKKPDPAAFLVVIERQKLNRAETAAVGDREIDIQAGKAAGLRTYLFSFRPAKTEADLVFHDYAELLKLLKETS